MNKNTGIKAALFINYFVFAILLNSVGIVIKQSLANYRCYRNRGQHSGSV